ncbi:prephenate dehydrogenase [Paracoccus lutimaris]|uniref:Prephenate dehydrogenase n=1 Tax=Paracoccus lutimaris TaxID=1490030 RepID=A0A368Z480_9RHOB|nr:prephenate dehydrogenase [Paracoccus lutimaris]RCW87221.1 prephenate dehydrogenase [Paracoccus lutimaris]
MSDPLPPLSVLIFGFGAFGQMAARVLAPHLPVAICDPGPSALQMAQGLGLPVVPPEAARQYDIVLLAVPVPALAACLAGIAPHLAAGQLVVDVCSVKEGPAALMRRLLPEGVEILATHPMFGPQSMPAAVRGGRIVICPLRGRRWRQVAGFLRGVLGLRVILTTPEHHDRHAALTQGLTHLLARALEDFQPHPRIRTRSFDLLCEALDMVRGDAPEVYEAVTAANPHVAPLRDKLAQLLAAAAARA